MMPKTAFVYTNDYANFRYSDSHPLKPYRLRLTRDVIHSYGLLDLSQSRVVETVAADRNTLQRFHAPDYVRVLEAAEAGAFHPEFAPYGFGPGGVDTFRDDPLAHTQLTTAGFLHVLEALKACAPRWIATGGGGYNLPNVARGWTLAWGVMNDVDIPNALPPLAIEALQEEGYHGKTLRDPEVLWHPAQRDSLQSEVDQALSYLQTHLFPIHGLT